MDFSEIYNKNNTQPLKDSLICRLKFLHSVALSAESEEEILEICNEIECVCHNIHVLDQLLVDSFLDMEGTVKKFIEKK